ncbi:response regulator transcription factor [Dissulfurirhabdus thermomarina]|uniref:Response regulator transcription factor n=1 Tax=Dissulfurirhabdus thermomarina TaxID=1765737 RepID=A0A6N9TK75_DISTH|nr:response regulator transcription factor [Dissulfurirhabdus thermomarina]NDY41489.1 response regulator transcription factor [Dissulfurirhabdus thermomarina]NMX23884.1 response regulator transcription factor [Dissulfurirhabdus thermomarina]
MGRARILVVDDEADIRQLLVHHFTRNGYHVEAAATGEEALRAVRAAPPDLVVLDLMLPGMEGLDVCRVLKGDPATRGVSVVMLTARGEEADIVAGLELGADDYVTKPFSPRVLVARVRAVLRRRAAPAPAAGEVIRAHGIVIHSGRHEVTVAGRPVDLTPTEFRLLRYLAARPGWVFTRGQIVRAVHGEDYPVTERSVDVQVVGLRKKLGPAGGVIETVRGVGYRFREEA